MNRILFIIGLISFFSACVMMSLEKLIIGEIVYTEYFGISLLCISAVALFVSFVLNQDGLDD
jgi:hypothetical protein